MNLHEQIADLDPHLAVAEALSAVCAGHSVETARVAGYVSVRPPGRVIAAYFNRRFVDIAVDPAESAGLAARVGASRVLRKKATHYVRVDASGLNIDAVLDGVRDALAWREQGRRWSGGNTGGA